MSKTCPNCGSDKISPDSNGFVKTHRNPSNWTCDKCGYTGPPIEGNSSDIDFNPEEQEKLVKIKPDKKTAFLFFTGLLTPIIVVLIFLVLESKFI